MAPRAPSTRSRTIRSRSRSRSSPLRRWVVAGKRYTATLQARRSDLAELSSAGDVTCFGQGRDEEAQGHRDLPGGSSHLLGRRAEVGEGKDAEGDRDPDSRRRARHADGVDEGQVARLLGRRLLVAACATGLCVAPAHGRGLDHNPVKAADPAGDSNGAPDVTGVTVANDLSGTILFVVEVANRDGFAASDDILIYIDTDRSAQTELPGPRGW